MATSQIYTRSRLREQTIWVIFSDCSLPNEEEAAVIMSIFNNPTHCKNCSQMLPTRLAYPMLNGKFADGPSKAGKGGEENHSASGLLRDYSGEEDDRASALLRDYLEFEKEMQM